MFVQVPHYGHCTSSFLLKAAERQGPGHAGHPMQESTHGVTFGLKGYGAVRELRNHRTQSSRKLETP